MHLSWNEIKSRALGFSREWVDAANEDAEAKPLLIAFFELFWPGLLLVEMKSRGKSLGCAYQQAMDYFPGIKESDLPRWVRECDFERFALSDLESGQTSDFRLVELHKHVRLFGLNQRLAAPA